MRIEELLVPVPFEGFGLEVGLWTTSNDSWMARDSRCRSSNIERKLLKFVSDVARVFNSEQRLAKILGTVDLKSSWSLANIDEIEFWKGLLASTVRWLQCAVVMILLFSFLLSKIGELRSWRSDCRGRSQSNSCESQSEVQNLISLILVALFDLRCIVVFSSEILPFSQYSPKLPCVWRILQL